MTEAPEELNLSQAPTMRAPKRWPLVNTLDSRDGEFTKDARTVNGYAEKSKITGLYTIEKRPGFAVTPVVSGLGGIGQGLFTYEYVNTVGSFPNVGKLYLTLFVAGDIAYSLFTNSIGVTTPPVNLGTVQLLLGNRFQFLGIPSVSPTILFSGDNTIAIAGVTKAYAYSNGVLTTLVGGDSSGFPSNTVPGFIYLNGFVYVMDYFGKIWQTTNQNQVTGVGSWSANFITAASEADIAVQLARQLVYVFAIKTWSTQIYYDAGNPFGSNLSPLPGALFNFGCLSADTFADLNGVLFWATRSKVGTSRIVMVTDLSPKFISNPAVEKALGLNAQGDGSWFSAAYEYVGHRFYLITNFNTNITMVYDIGEELWYLWTDYQGSFYPISAVGGPNNAQWHQAFLGGNIYLSGPDFVYSNDFGNVVPVDIYTPNYDAGVDRGKVLSQMRFNTDQTPGSKLFIRSSDDDYTTWSNFRSVDLGKKRPIITDEGTFYRRAYHFRHYADTKFRITSVDLQMDIGTL